LRHRMSPYTGAAASDYCQNCQTTRGRCNTGATFARHELAIALNLTSQHDRNPPVTIDSDEWTGLTLTFELRPLSPRFVDERSGYASFGVRRQDRQAEGGGPRMSKSRLWTTLVAALVCYAFAANPRAAHAQRIGVAPVRGGTVVSVRGRGYSYYGPHYYRRPYYGWRGYYSRGFYGWPYGGYGYRYPYAYRRGFEGGVGLAPWAGYVPRYPFLCAHPSSNGSCVCRCCPGSVPAPGRSSSSNHASTNNRPKHSQVFPPGSIQDRPRLDVAAFRPFTQPNSDRESLSADSAWKNFGEEPSTDWRTFGR